jgi:hypothetical protein
MTMEALALMKLVFVGVCLLPLGIGLLRAFKPSSGF